jgi:REP element-mobilizing transposase RayT
MDDHCGRKKPADSNEDFNPGGPTLVFLTVCIRHGRLDHHGAMRALVTAWKSANWWKVGRFVIMPDHLHLFCAPNEPTGPLKVWVQRWKSSSTRNWPEGFQKPSWQRGGWDRQLRSGESYDQKWNYVRENPVRAGLVRHVDDWPWQGELNPLEWE